MRTIGLCMTHREITSCFMISQYAKRPSNGNDYKPKARYYNLFGPDLSQEECLSLNIPKYRRSLFAVFRCDVLLLRVEICRFLKKMR